MFTTYFPTSILSMKFAMKVLYSGSAGVAFTAWYSERMKLVSIDISFVDSTEKKLRFTKSVSDYFSLDAKVYPERAEELIKKMLATSPEPKQKLKFKSFQDIRVFTNTLKHALELMRDGGVDADMETNSFDWGIEYIIKVKNE